MCTVYCKKKIHLENGGEATRVVEVGPAVAASGFAPGSENPAANNGGSRPAPGHDSSARSGLVPTGRGHRDLIRGNTAAWR